MNLTGKKLMQDGSKLLLLLLLFYIYAEKLKIYIKVITRE